MSIIKLMTRFPQSQSAISFLSKPKVPLPSLFQSRLGAHGWKSLSGFRIFCTGQDLSTKECVPCDAKDLQPMTEEVANDLIQKISGWNLGKENGVLKLNRSWKVKSFTKGLELFQRVAGIAEAEGHHPDLHLVGWNNVTIDIWTHAVGGLTENDFILASKINGISLENLLRRKAPAKAAI